MMRYAATSGMFFFGDPPERGIRKDQIKSAQWNDKLGTLLVSDMCGEHHVFKGDEAKDFWDYLTRGIIPIKLS